MSTNATSLLEPTGHMVWHDSHGVAAEHTIYSLIGCPAPINGTWILVRRDAEGVRHKLAEGRTENSAPSNNLAVIRFYGAQLGANEVHLDGPVVQAQGSAGGTSQPTVGKGREPVGVDA